MTAAAVQATGAGGLPVVLILLCVVVIPIAAVAFARSGKGLEELGKGRFAVDFDESGEAERHEEIRQLVQAKAFRQEQRGERPVHVETEIERLLGGGHEADSATAETDSEPPVQVEGGIREEIRQVVIASNERRERRGEEPLDVEAEVDRMMREFG